MTMARTGKGTGRIYQRGATWWIDYGHRGQRYRESAESTKRGEAVALLKRRLAEMGGGTFTGPAAERVTLKQVMELVRADYEQNGRKSAARLRQSTAHLMEHFGEHCRALDVTVPRVNGYVEERRAAGAGAKPATVQNELAALRRGFTLAVRAGMLVQTIKVPRLEIDNTRAGFFTDAEVQAVTAVLPAALRPIVRFAFLTGWRKGEILALEWRSVDWQAKEVRLDAGRTKNREGRVFPFAAYPELEALLTEQHDRTRAVERASGSIVPCVFHRAGKQVREFRAAWARACERAGLAGRLFHDLRRSAVRRLEQAGVSRSVAMKLTGHKTESVYRRYAIVDASALSEGVAKLARLAESNERTIIPIASNA
jgi:integrase